MLYETVERLALWLNALPPWYVVMLLGVVLGLPTTIIHELGHGIAANKLAGLPVRIQISFNGFDWPGVCVPDPQGPIPVGRYMAVIAGGPLASLAQALVATLLTSQMTAGTAAYAVVAVFALWGWLAAVTNAIPFETAGIRSDGQLLLDLTRLARTGRRADWLREPPPADPHAATSVAPPG